MRTAKYYRNQIKGEIWMSDQVLEQIGPWLMKFDRAIWELLDDDPHIKRVEYADAWDHIRVKFYAWELRQHTVINDDILTYYRLPTGEKLFGDQTEKDPRAAAKKYVDHFKELYATGLADQIKEWLDTEERYGV